MKKLILAVAIAFLAVPSYGNDNITTDNSSIVPGGWPLSQSQIFTMTCFQQMALIPTIRQAYQPENVWNICLCIKDRYEEAYPNYEEVFLEIFGNAGGLTDAQKFEAWNNSYMCSINEQLNMQGGSGQTF